MKVKIHDIPLEGLDLVEDEWYKTLVRESFPDSEASQSKLKLHLHKTCDNVSIDGEGKFQLEPACDRCAEKFSLPIQYAIHQNLVPKETAQFDDVDANQEDENISYYEGHDIDLGEILRELILLAVPYRKICQESCQGLCPQCGHNLNTGPCSCKKDSIDPRFAVLKNYKAS